MNGRQKNSEAKSQVGWDWNPCAAMTEQDSLDQMIWAGSFIWAGVVVLLAHYSGYPEGQAWSLFFLGAGTLVLCEIVARMVLPAYRTPVLGDVIWAALLFGLGTDSWGWILPFILLTIGSSLLWSVRLRS